METMDFYRNDDRGGFGVSDLYRGRKRACKTKGVVGITLKKGDVLDTHAHDHKGFLFSTFFPGRKVACKSKPVQQIPVDDGGGLISRKRKSPSQLQLNPRLVHIVETENEWTMEKWREVEYYLTLDYRSKDVIPGCGTLDQYQTLGLISRGSYGAVYRAVDKRSGEVVAVKDETEGLSISSLREIHILISLPPHPCIVELKEVVVDDVDGLYVVMECMEYDLRGYMKAKELSLGEIKMLMKQLLEGVKFLHQNMVMHRDIKPSNILVNSEGALKLCDFGLSMRFKAEGGRSYSPHVGTLPYRAPEMLGGEKGYSCAVDMWSVGCTMAELLTKQVLFRGRPSSSGQLHAIHRILRTSDDQLRSKLCGAAPLLSEAGLDLVSKLLRYDPTHRISAKSALDHAWFNEST